MLINDTGGLNAAGMLQNVCVCVCVCVCVRQKRRQKRHLVREKASPVHEGEAVCCRNPPSSAPAPERNARCI